MRIVQTSALIHALVATSLMVCATMAVFQAGKANIVRNVCISSKFSIVLKRYTNRKRKYQ